VDQFLNSVQAIGLEGMAHATPPSELLAELCRSFETHIPGTVAGVTILDRSLQIFEHGIFPSLSPTYGEALNGIEVAGRPGSCALAVFNGETVICDDVANDPRFTRPWRDLGVAHGLNAVASIPAVNGEGITLGTFVVAYSPESPPDSAGMHLAHRVAGLCAQVLTYRRNQLNHDLLVGELQHRVRNLFSTIGAVVYATLKSHPDPESFRRIFDGRLVALAKAHSLALESDETDLRQLLVDTLAPYSIDHDVRINGPQLLLSQQAAVAFGLAAHELATNAAKYGSLSRNGGSVEIGWDFEQSGEGETTFALSWRERGGPEVVKPERQGYGQKTLSRSLSAAFDGKVELDYQREGLSCTIIAPHSRRLGAQAN
jgi:two-component sensor histidine kinase